HHRRPPPFPTRRSSDLRTNTGMRGLAIRRRPGGFIVAVVLRVSGFTLAELLTRAVSRTRLRARLVGTARDGQDRRSGERPCGTATRSTTVAQGTVKWFNAEKRSEERRVGKECRCGRS